MGALGVGRTRHRAILSLLVLLFAACSIGGGNQQTQGGEPPDLVLLNGKVLTVDSHDSIAQAVAIKGGRFVAVGSTSSVKALAGSSTKVVELGGRTAVPGLIDSHMHMVRATNSWWREVRLDGVRDLQTALELYRAKAQQLQTGDWLITRGGWVPGQLAEKRFPTLAEIDAVTPANPVYIQPGAGDRVMLNTKALAAAGIDAGTADPPNGKIEKDGAGAPTGILSGAAGTAVTRFIPKSTPEQRLQGARQMTRDLNRNGITSVNDVGGNAGIDTVPDVASPIPQISRADYDAVMRLYRDRQLTVRVAINYHSFAGIDDIRQRTTGSRPAGDDLLKVNGVAEQVMAALQDPTVPRPFAITDDAKKQYRDIVSLLAKGGWTFQQHSALDATNSTELEVWSAVNQDTPIRPLHWSLAHVFQLSPSNLQRAKDLGIGLTLQDQRTLEDGPHPPLRTAMESGVPIGGGTDSTVVSPYKPFIWFWYAVTGGTYAGSLLPVDQRLSRMQALRAYTVGSAWFTTEESKKGSIEKGKLADLAVLSDDYLTVPDDRLPGLESVLTVLGGRPVYGSGAFADLASAA